MNHTLKSIVFLFLFSISSYSQSVNVPLDYWGYTLLDRWATQGMIRSFDLFTRPLSRTEFAKLLKQIHQMQKEQPETFTNSEYRLLEQLLADFDEIPSAVQEKHLYAYKEKDSEIDIDIYGKSHIGLNKRSHSQPDSLYSKWTLGGITRGHIGHSIGFYLDASNMLIRGNKDIQDSDEQFDPSQGIPKVVSGQNVYNDRAVAYFVMEKPWARLQIGQDEFSWGPDLDHGLTLDLSSHPAEMIGLSVPFNRFQFSYIHAFLKSGLTSKYLAAHRLDIKLFKTLFLSASETIIYGNRNVELGYLNPLMPFHIAEHHLGDRDNNNLSFDFTFYPAKGVKIWGEYFIDDMTTTKSLTRYFGNKFAFQTGLNWVDPVGITNSQISFRWTRIEPYVYTHWDTTNIYTHYNTLIGSHLGPNSESLKLTWMQWLGRDLHIALFLNRIRKGKGKANTNTKPAEGESKQFLQGIIEKRSSLGLMIRQQIQRDVFIGLEYFYSDINNIEHQLGQDGCTHNSRFTLQINY